MIIKMKIVQLLGLLLLGFGLHAQNIPFAFTFGGNGNDGGYDVVESADLGYVACGQTGSFTYGASDMYMFKTDINGNLLWRKHFGGTASEGAKSIINAHGSGFLLAGYTNSYGNGGYDYYLVRTDDNGDTLWTKTFGGTDWDFAHSVCTTSNGNYVVVGESYSFGNGKEIYLVYFDDSGNALDSLIWGGIGDQTVGNVLEYDNGKIVFTGSTFSSDWDQYLVGYDWIAQSYVFQNIVTAPGNQLAYVAQPSPSGGFSTFGSHELTNGVEMMTGVFQNDGSHIGNTILFIPGEDLVLYTSKIYGNEFVTGGYRRQVGTNTYLPTFYHLDQYGNFIAGGALSSQAFNATYGITAVTGGGVVMTGYMEGYGPGPSSALLWKLDSNLAGSGNPSPVVSVSEADPQAVSSIQVFPNPFFETLIVNVPADLTIKEATLINLNGQKFSLTQVTNGTYQTSRTLADGVYILQLTLDNGTHYREKMVKMP